MVKFRFRKTNKARVYEVYSSKFSTEMILGEFIPKRGIAMGTPTPEEVGGFARPDDATTVPLARPFYMRHLKDRDFEVVTGFQVLEPVGTMRLSAQHAAQARKNFPARKLTYAGVIRPIQ